MTPKDNNKLTLLAYSDYLEENNQVELAEEIREEINNTPSLYWAYESTFIRADEVASDYAESWGRVEGINILEHEFPGSIYNGVGVGAYKNGVGAYKNGVGAYKNGVVSVGSEHTGAPPGVGHRIRSWE